MARPRNPTKSKEKSEFEQKLVDLRRVARVVAGGRRFSFRATLIIGNRKGEVGVGVGKGLDTALAIEKAFKQAKKNLVKVPITENGTIPHEARGKFGSAQIVIRPAPKGRGVVAGSSARTVLDFAGYSNVSAKIVSSSKNKLNNARATLVALKKLRA